MRPASRVVVVGGGIFGVTASLALRRRGHDVCLIDPGPLPHPLAASTDISKMIRMDYGPDGDYLGAMEAALEGWRAWNRAWPEPLFHETGVTFLTRGPMRPGEFEYESFERLQQRGHAPQRLDSALIARRFPAWNAAAYSDGYFNPHGGYAESGRVVLQLIGEAQAAGVEVRGGQALAGWLEAGGHITGVVTHEGERLAADSVVLAAGSWTPRLAAGLLPELSGVLRSNAMPVFHLRPAEPALFTPDRFPPFGADISHTGYYGFCLHPREGVVKVANHGDGRAMHPDSPERLVTAEQTRQLREFLRGTFPALAEAPIVYTRMCLYCDTWDGHFWIAAHPGRPGLVLATGGSGHGFKFAPLLGEWIADATEGRPNPLLEKFGWRPEARPSRSEEAARFQE